MRQATFFLLCLHCTLAFGAEPYEDVKARFESNFWSADKNNKIALKNQAIVDLQSDPERYPDPRYTELMYEVVDRAETWYDIGCALQYWTKATGPAREKIAADLIDPKAKLSPKLREVLAFMLYDYARYYRELSEAEQAAVLECLSDEQPSVRRYAALATQGMAIRETLEALHSALKSEKNEGVSSYIVESLRQLTGAVEVGRSPKEWREWLDANPEWELRPGFNDPDIVKGTYGDLEVEFEEGQSGGDHEIWVLPPSGLTNRFFDPGLSVLESLGKITYIRVPLVGPDVEIVKDADDNELYPMDALVEALEILREEKQVDSMVMVGFQEASWPLIRYAQLHPDHVKALVIVSGWIDKDSFISSLRELQAKGIEEEDLHAQVTSGKTPYSELTPSLQYSSKVGRVASMLHNPDDVYGCFIWEKLFELRNPRQLVFPDVELDKKDKIKVPVLFVHGADDPMNSIKYTSFQGKLYFKPRPKAEEIKGSGPMPWHDAPDQFLAVVEKFLKKIR